MSCEYCKHRSVAYEHRLTEDGHIEYDKLAETLPHNIEADDDVREYLEPEPVISWWQGKPYLCVNLSDEDESLVSIEITHCPMCGEALGYA